MAQGFHAYEIGNWVAAVLLSCTYRSSCNLRTFNPTGRRICATDCLLQVAGLAGTFRGLPLWQSQELSRSLAGRCQVCAATHLPPLGRCRACRTLRKPMLADLILEALKLPAISSSDIIRSSKLRNQVKEALFSYVTLAGTELSPGGSHAATPCASS